MSGVVDAFFFTLTPSVPAEATWKDGEEKEN